MSDTQDKVTYSFLLGRMKDDAHLDEISSIAALLDRTKFTCFCYVREKMIVLDVEPWPDHEQYWPLEKEQTTDGFKMYAAELLIHSLAKKLGER
jgi:hypothetical protein